MDKPIKLPKSFIRRLKAEQKKLATCRDNLRQLIEQYESLSDSCEQGYDELEGAIQTLSQYV